MPTNPNNKGPILRGKALEVAVKTAEAPITGSLVKELFFRQLGISDMLAVDLDGREAITPLAPICHAYEEPNDE